MKIDRKKKVFYNSISNGIYQIVVMASGLILPRFILVTYGSAYNGLVTSLMQFLGITEVLTIGLAGAARAELYKSLAYNDINRTSGIIKAISQYMNKAAAVFCLYMLTLLFVYPYFVKDAFSFWEVAPLLLIIGIGNIISYICGYAYNVLLDADNTVYYYSLLRSFLTIANVALSIIFIKSGFSIQIVKLVGSIIFAIGPVFLLLVVPKIYKLNRKASPEHSWRKNQKYAAAHSIALIIHENTDAALLTILTTTKTVSVYSVYNLVIKGLKGVLGVFTTSMEPLFGNMWAKKEIDTMKSTLNHYEYFIGFFISISLSSAMGLILPFVSLYTKGVTDIEYVLPVFAFFIIMAELARCIRIPYLTVVQAAGKYKETQTGAFVEAGLNILTSIILTIRFGIVGVVIGTLIANLYRTFYYSWFVSRHLLTRSIKNTFYLIIWSFSNVIINAKLFSLFCKSMNFEMTSWPKWVLGAIIIVTMSLIETFISSGIFYKSELVWLGEYIKKYTRRFKKREK